jgi:glycosyltransferase involved in cell wall biosynthesis
LKTPTISVVIPITRYETELEEALVSVFGQSFQDFEIVLVDNHASPGTLAVAARWEKSHPCRIRVVHEERRGAASARNRGIVESQGEYVALLDSDDRMKPIRLSVQLDAILRNPEIALVGAWKDEVSPDGKTIIRHDAKPEIPRWAEYIFRHTERFRSEPLVEPQTSTFFFRKETALSADLFDIRFDPFWLEDSEFVLRMYEKGRVSIVPESLTEFRLHTTSDANRRIYDFDLITKHDLFFTILRDKYYSADDRESVRGFRKLRSRWLRESGIKILNLPGGERIGRKMISNAASEDPLNYKNWETLFLSGLSPSFRPKPFGVLPGPDDALPTYANETWAMGLFSLETPESRASDQ